MSERIQDQRPVFMGTFSKYTRAFESRVALMENDIEQHKKALKRHIERIEKAEMIAKYAFAMATTGLLAILMLETFM